jgi:DivIVA domain-containing protein
MKGAMSMNQPDAKAGKYHPDRPPDFRVVLRGYDRAEVDQYLPQLMARLREAVDRYAQAEQARAELEREIGSLREGSFQQLGGDAAAVLQEAGRSGEQLVERARQRTDNIVHKAQTQAQQLRAEVTGEAQRRRRRHASSPTRFAGKPSRSGRHCASSASRCASSMTGYWPICVGCTGRSVACSRGPTRHLLRR